MLTFGKYKCLKCGYKFVRSGSPSGLGNASARCPKCGAAVTIIWA